MGADYIQLEPPFVRPAAQMALARALWGHLSRGGGAARALTRHRAKRPAPSRPLIARLRPAAMNCTPLYRPVGQLGGPQRLAADAQWQGAVVRAKNGRPSQ